jgi:hypothetical protein
VRDHFSALGQFQSRGEAQQRPLASAVLSDDTRHGASGRDGAELAQRGKVHGAELKGHGT